MAALTCPRVRMCAHGAMEWRPNRSVFSRLAPSVPGIGMEIHPNLDLDEAFTEDEYQFMLENHSPENMSMSDSEVMNVLVVEH